MPSLKEFRLRIRSVKSTQKITSAMKMVAAAKLRRAQEQAEQARPYALRLGRIIASLARGTVSSGNAPPLIAGSGRDQNHLVIVATADRGLCGPFNSSIVRDARALIRKLQGEGKNVRVFTVGRKGRDLLRREYGKLFVESVDMSGKKRYGFSDAEAVAARATRMFEAGEIDVATIVYARFKSAMTQVVTRQQLIPVAVPDAVEDLPGKAVYDYEPDEETILRGILPRNLAVQVYGALLENAASEHGARMSAMDSATRNAGDMIDRLTLNYNRSRQASITKELIEIISGAEAV